MILYQDLLGNPPYITVFLYVFQVVAVYGWELDRMGDSQLDEFLEGSFLYDYQKEELTNTSKKLQLYQDYVFYYEMNEAQKSIVEFHTFIQKNRIFLSPDLKEKFKEIDDVMWSAYVDMEVGHQAQENKMKRDAWKTVRDKVEPIKNEIEDLVLSRLHYDQAE